MLILGILLASVSASTHAAEADRLATMAAVYCAEGSNIVLTQVAMGSNELHACRRLFRQAGAQGAPFEADSSILEQDGSRFTLYEFERRFGVPGHEFVRRMLQSRGDMEELRKMVVPKISADRFNKASSGPVSDSEADHSIKFNGKVTKGFTLPASPSAAPAEELSVGKTSARGSEVAATPAPLGALEPLTQKELLGQEDEPEESVFSAVRRKYLEIHRRQRLLR